MRNQIRHALKGLVMLAAAGTAWAGAPQPFSEDLFLDWDGFREALRQEGIDFRVGYVSETATNAQGGDRRLVSYTDQWTFMGTLDLNTLFSVPNAILRIAITDRNGRNLSGDAHLDSLQQVQEVYGRGQTWRITQFWYDQQYLGGMLDWKIGRITDGEDFAAFSCEFMNLTFCGSPPGNLVGSYWYNWPVSQWATRVKANFKGFGYVQLGAYEVNPSYLQVPHAFGLGDPAGATGVLVPFEIGWLPTFGQKFDGSYKLGGWYNSSRGADVVTNTAGLPLLLDGGTPRMHDGQYGGYINFLQSVTAPSSGDKRGVKVFLNATFTDRQTSTLDNQIAIGLLATGLFDARPDDDMGFAVGRTHVNSRVAAAERLVNAAGRGPVGVQTAEYASELFWSFNPAPWIALRPNVQYVWQPGGLAHTTDDVVVGLKVSINL
jgi:porin